MSEGPKLTVAGKIAVFLFIAACIGGAYYLFVYRQGSSPGTPAGTAAPADRSKPAATAAQPTPAGETVEIGVAYGTEKERWLKWAVEQFAETDEGRGIKVDLIPMGSVEGAKAVLSGDERIHVWSPASALYKDVFVQDWQVKHGKNPILKGENLALTPMVFVAWEERYNAFIEKYKELTFKTIGRALQEQGGWEGIAGKPEWGMFKFGHTNPNRSNSGLMALVLMAYDYSDTCGNLTLKNIVDTDFQEWMQKLENGVTGLIDSTGTMMKDMVLKGPASYDVVLVYENTAIDYLKNAEGRWGTLQVVYPRKNAWNENPYYIIDAPWSSDAQRKAAETLLTFLLTEPIQKRSLVHGFRPGNPSVAIKFPESPFVKYEQYGIKIDLHAMCDLPEAEVINNLLASWIRTQGVR